MFKQMASGARDTVTSALEEARLRGDRRLGTEHLLLGLLHDPGSAAARALGTDLTTARAGLRDLDRAALACVGVDVSGMELPAIPASRKRTPFSSAARGVLERAVRETARARSRRITPEHLLVALLECEHPDPAAELLDQLDIDRTAVRVRIGAGPDDPVR